MIELDGESLSVENLMRIGRGDLKVKVCIYYAQRNRPIDLLSLSVCPQVSESALNRVRKSRKVVDDIIASNKGPSQTHTTQLLQRFSQSVVKRCVFLPLQ